MGQFSWFTNDSKRRIRAGKIMTVYLCDDKGNKWRENCYEGYGVFGVDVLPSLKEWDSGVINDSLRGRSYIIYPQS